MTCNGSCGGACPKCARGIAIDSKGCCSGKHCLRGKQGSCGVKKAQKLPHRSHHSAYGSFDGYSGPVDIGYGNSSYGGHQSGYAGVHAQRQFVSAPEHKFARPSAHRNLNVTGGFDNFFGKGRLSFARGGSKGGYGHSHGHGKKATHGHDQAYGHQQAYG